MYSITLQKRKIHTSFSKMIIYRLRKDWNQGVQKEIQLPLKKGHLKQIWQNVRDLTKLGWAAKFMLPLYCS